MGKNDATYAVVAKYSSSLVERSTKSLLKSPSSQTSVAVGSDVSNDFIGLFSQGLSRSEQSERTK